MGKAKKHSPEQQEIIDQSKSKSDWMAGKKVDSLETLLMTKPCLLTWA